MAGLTNRGGQKQGNLDPDRSEQQRGTTAGGSGERSDRDKQEDQRTNPDDARRQATDQQR
jgi:hypothetical protein